MNNKRQGFTMTVFSKYNSERNLTSVFVTGFEVTGWDLQNLEENVENLPVFQLVKRNVMGRVYFHVEPLEAPKAGNLGWMASGDIVDMEIDGQTEIMIHDRQETPEQYKALSQ